MKILSDMKGRSTDFPPVIRIEPSALCNLKCIHCPTGNLQANRGIMPYNLFLSIMEEIKAYKNVRVGVLYHGGEPFLNRNIFKMIRSLKSMGISFVKVVTNGMLIKKSKLVDIIDSGLDSIEFSIDGDSPEENNRIRRGSNYRQVSGTIKELLKLKDEMKSQYPAIYISSAQVKLHYVKGATRKPLTPSYIRDDFIEFKGKVGFKNTYLIEWPGFKFGKDLNASRKSPVKKSRIINHCSHIWETITVRWNGDVVPCCYDIVGSHVMGNILSDSLKDIWNNGKYRQLRKVINEGNPPDLCAKCNVLNADS